MSSVRIIAIILVKNEDIFIKRVVTNILDFCDEIIITDHMSNDNTHAILQKMKSEYPKIKLLQIDHLKESHKTIEKYAGTDTWMFGVDGDEIYDPEGLKVMRTKLLSGEFQHIWSIKGNALNCTEIDIEKGTAKGYLAPPARSMTKLYNFACINSWTECPERLHSGTIRFKNDIDTPVKMNLYKTMNWEQSYFRCLHAVFIQRSSLKNRNRWNPSEILSVHSAFVKKSYITFIRRYLFLRFGYDWKQRKYRIGHPVKKNIVSFFNH